MNKQDTPKSFSLTHLSLAGLLALAGTGSGCAAACEDDGLLQERCPAVASAGTDTDSDSGSNGDAASAGNSADGSASADGTGGASADGGGATAPDGDGGATDPDGDGGATDPDADGGATDPDAGDSGSDDAGVGTSCLDADGDGFGDPTDCDNPPGDDTVDNGDDCDDTDPNTFPGAATEAPGECMSDADGDGWGDAAPGPGIVAGADCWDGNANLNPGLVSIGAVDNALIAADQVVRIVTDDARLVPLAPLDAPLLGMSITGTSIRSDGHIFSNDDDGDRLREIEYGAVCAEQAFFGDVVGAPSAHGVGGICGLAFDDMDTLWALDGGTNTLQWIDEGTGLAHDPIPLTLDGQPLDIDSCGMTWDCHEQRLLVADIEGDRILTVDRTTGEAIVVADVSLGVGSGGLTYEPVARVLYVVDGTDLTHVPLDGTDATHVGTLHYEGLIDVPSQIANLAPVLDCVP